MESASDILKRFAPEKSSDSQQQPIAAVQCQICQDRGIVIQGEVARPCVCMDHRKTENRFKYARLSGELLRCRFQNFCDDFYAQGHTAGAQKAYQAAVDFAKNVLTNPQETGLLFTGEVGSGKTFLAASIANELLEQERQVLFLVVPDLLDQLRASFDGKSQWSEFDLLDVAKTEPVLILDDLGAHNYTEWVRNRLYTILNYRMNEQLPTVITTNLNFEEIDDYLGARTLSRLLQMCRVFRLTVAEDIRRQKYKLREGLGRNAKKQ